MSDEVEQLKARIELLTDECAKTVVVLYDAKARVTALKAALTKIALDDRVPPWVRSVAHSALARDKDGDA